MIVVFVFSLYFVSLVIYYISHLIIDTSTTIIPVIYPPASDLFIENPLGNSPAIAFPLHPGV